ncbi:hypothetical protein HG531_011961 [Fusarium graminearum]|nr:hypothetical protein HG531_011961 [Fusarium graminearum]
MFFEEELLRHVQIRVITNLRPGTKAMSVNANQEHSILFSTPSTGIVGCLCRIRKAKRVPVTMAANSLSKELKLFGTFDSRLSIHLLQVAKVFVNSFLGCLDKLIEDGLDVVLVSLLELGIFDNLIAAVVHRSISEVGLDKTTLLLVSQRTFGVGKQDSSVVVVLFVSLFPLTFLETISTIILVVAVLDRSPSRCAFSCNLGNVGFMLLLFLFSLDLSELIGWDDLIPIEIDIIHLNIGDLHEVVPIDATTTEINLVVYLCLCDFSILKDGVNIELFKTFLVAALLKHLGGTHLQHHLNIF